MARSDLASVHRHEILEELQQRTSRVVLLGSVLLGQILILLAEGCRLPLDVSVIGLFLILFPLAALVLAERWYQEALWLLVLGLLATVLIASFRFHSGAILCLSALPIVLVSILFGQKHGLLIAVLTSL